MVVDVQPIVLFVLLEFIYSGRIEPECLTRWAAKLWLVADQFEMPLLKQVATKQLKVDMTDADCLELLTTLAKAGRRPDVHRGSDAFERSVKAIPRSQRYVVR